MNSEQRGAQPASSAGVLSASGLGSWRDSLSTALEEASALDDSGRAEVLRALEQLVCTATAAQAAVAAELDVSRRSAAADAGVPVVRRGQGVAALVAHARRESPHRGQAHVALARIVRVELPHTWAAWRTGRVTEWVATVIARETGCLSLEHRLAVDESVAADADRLESMSLGELTGFLRREAERLDAAAVVKRRRRAEGERHVSLRPAPDTMTYLTALLPVKDGVAAFAALTRGADSARAAGDERSKGQVMADTLVARILTEGFAARSDRASIIKAPPVELGLVMTDQALFGGTDDGAHLVGYGPIPAELAREIIVGALTAQERVGIRRLYTRPETGELVAMESTTRNFRGNLAQFIRLRDQKCRTPWCDAPIRHLDHATPDHDGGMTSALNGQGLCEACNYAKESTGWHTRPAPGPDPGGAVETTLPTGVVYRTRAPAIATITHTHLPPLKIDYVLTG